MTARPLLIEEFHGTRSWWARRDGQLTGVTCGTWYEWREGRNVAHCLPFPSWGHTVDPPKHTPGSIGCPCGFHAYYDGSDDYQRSYTITGVIAGSGLVTAGARGFRAQYARIVAFVVPPSSRVHSFNRWGLVHAVYPTVPVFTTLRGALVAFPLTPIGQVA